MDKQLKGGPNFTPAERTLLCRLGKKYVAVIENKKTDAVTWKQKTGCWEKIAVEFNCENTNIQRAADTLKKKWDNIKTTVKEKMTGQRKYALGTGGGPPLPSPRLTDEEVDIFEIIQVQVSGLKSVFDCDRDPEKVTSNDIDAEEQLFEIPIPSPSSFEEADDTVKIDEQMFVTQATPGCSTNDWSSYSPAVLRTPRAPLLKKNTSSILTSPPKDVIEKEDPKENPLQKKHPVQKKNIHWSSYK